MCRVFHKHNTGVVYTRRSPPHNNDVVASIDSIVDHLLQSPSKLPPLTDFPPFSGDDKPPAPLPCSPNRSPGDDHHKPPSSSLFYPPHLLPPNPNSAITTAALKTESVSQDTDVTPTEISWELLDGCGGGGTGVGSLYDDSMADLDRYYSFFNYY